MALPAGTVLEVRATGADTNGGGFVAGAAGTDFSQQDAAQYSGTNLAVDATTNTKVTSATHNFVAADVGNLINISAGASWTTGFYRIVSVAANAATLDRSPAATSTTGGTFAVGGALLTLKKAMDNWVASNIVWVKNGAYSIGTGVSPAAVNTLPNATPNMILGYNSARGDNPTGSSRPTFTATAAIDILTVNDANVLVAYLIFDCNSTGNRGLVMNAANADRGSRVAWVSGRNFKTNGIKSVARARFQHCDATGGNSGATGGFFGAGNYYGCVASGNVCNGFDNGGADSMSLHFCLAAGNSGANHDGFAFDSNALQQCELIHCVSYGNARDGVRFQGTYQALSVLGCILTANGGYGINSGQSYAIAVPHFDYNAFYSNTSGARNNLIAGAHDVTLTGDPFTSASGGDFSLNNTAGAGAACRAASEAGAFPGISSTGYLDLGAVQHADPAGGGTTIAGTPMLRGMVS